MMFGAYVVSRSVMFERSSILPNIEALHVNSPVPPCDCKRKCTKPCPFLRMFLFTKIYSRRGVFNAYLQILLLDFSPF